MKIPVLLCDDDNNLLNYYKDKIQEIINTENFQAQIIQVSTNAEQVIETLKNDLIDGGIYFLDIELASGKNGIDLAEKINQLDSEANIIFLTSYEEYAIYTLQREIKPLDFIVKSSEKEQEQLVRALKNATQKNNKEAVMAIKVLNRKIKIKLSDIFFIETSAEPHKVILHGKNIQYPFYASMKNLENKGYGLVRVHESFLINPENIESIDFTKRKIYFNKRIYCFFSAAKLRLVKKLFK